MKIVTLTLNPAFDMHCHMSIFKPRHENLAEVTALDTGGKGVNISRALMENGADNLAVVIVGEENGDAFCKALEKDGLRVSAVTTAGRIRENITLHPENDAETRISFDGFVCGKEILEEVRARVGDTNENTIVTLTGSNPKGITVQDVTEMLTKMKQTGAKIVIDSRSFMLEELLAFRPWLIKPNKDEAETYTGKKIERPQDAVEIASQIYRAGVENVIVSLGGDGAVLACKAGVFYAQTPAVEIASTIGAGDSLIAGFVDGYAKGLPIERVFARAVSFGTAACMQEGTRPPKAKQVAEIEPRVRVQKL